MIIEQENRDGRSTAATYLLPSFTEYSDPNVSPSNTSGQRRYSQTDVYDHTDNARSDGTISRTSSVTEQGGVMQSENPLQSNGRTSSVSIATSCASSATREDSITSESCGKLFKKVLKNGFGWWWWEVGASALSFISIVLIFIFLGKVNGMALANWNGPVQPNTVISILTTTIRTCLMIPIASCLGQYKWKHFRRPAELETLQTLDEASRGPWGSLMLVSSAKFWRSTTALCLSMVTILALGIEPSAQQILSFPVREILLPNTTAQIGYWNTDSGVAMGNASTSTWGWDSARQTTYTYAAMLNGALGSPLRTDFYCPQPATRCSWDDFSTLAVCIDTSPDPPIDVSCGKYYDRSGREEPFCNFTIRQNSSVCHFENEPVSLENPTPMMIHIGNEFISYTKWLTCDDSSSLVENFAITRLPYIDGNVEIDTLKLAESVFSKWTWCKKTFHNISATPHGVESSSVSEKPLKLNSDNYFFCDGSGSISSTAPNQFYCSGYLTGILDALLQQNWEIRLSFRYPFDMANFTRNIADTFNSVYTALGAPAKLTPQTLPGNAYYNEVYIQVRWCWLILPVMETILTGLLLGISIKLNHDEPLYKNSVLAYLSHGLEGWEKGEIDIRPPESVDKLEEVLGRQIAKLGRGEDGLLKLRKE
ncbi:hypothetical protein F4806DRAFT_5914 [Annulohypoxylon nitens]|nr:hypothetical protein F4806DRAFT_5914 [Annulohypoxylon nitens]